jgi:hypothetical protein
MSFTLRFDLECAVRLALPALKQSLSLTDLEYIESDDALVGSIVKALESQTRPSGKPPRPISRHEECQECDAMMLVHQGRTSWDDDGDEEGGWCTHCDVCMEIWPCAEAGKHDQDVVKQLQDRYQHLRTLMRPTVATRSEQEKLRLRLEAEKVLPS